MGMTIPREESTKTALSMRRHFNDLYEIPHDLAIALSAFGPMAQAVADMAREKVKAAKVDVKGKALLDKRATVLSKIDKKVKPVMDALANALGNIEVNDGFRDLVASQACKSELAEIAEIDKELAQLALSHKKDIVDKALVAIMGQPTGSSDFPLCDTVYIIQNNANYWKRVAFAFVNSNVPDAIYVENGDGWDVIDCDLSNEYAYKLFTSPRALLKFAYVYNTLPERLPTMLQTIDDNYNPMAGITPKAKANTEDYGLEDWLDSWTT